VHYKSEQQVDVNGIRINLRCLLVISKPPMYIMGLAHTDDFLDEGCRTVGCKWILVAAFLTIEISAKVSWDDESKKTPGSLHF